MSLIMIHINDIYIVEKSYDEERMEINSINFNIDDHVDLWWWHKLVGKGIVSDTSRDVTCQTIPLPKNCLRVNIVKAIISDYKLPYGHLGT